MPGIGLYTVISEYEGGTYVTQVKAVSPRGAISAWLHRSIALSNIPTDIRSQIKADLMADEPIVISGCRNVWCSSASAGKVFVLVNVVRTSAGIQRNHNGS
jgi:SH3-like domain-containing protein